MGIEPYGRMKDILLGYDTDLHFDNGDLLLTSGKDYIEREIYKLLITYPGDWKANPSIGCTPNQFTGKQNTRETAKEIKNALEDGLKLTVAPAQVNVRVVPTNESSIMIFIDVISQDFSTMSFPFIFDYVNGIKKTVIRDVKTEKPKPSSRMHNNNIAHMRRPNKYWSRMRNSHYGGHY